MSSSSCRARGLAIDVPVRLPSPFWRMVRGGPHTREVAADDVSMSVLRTPAHVLVVDDDPRIRAILAAMLERHGYTYEVAANAREARDRLQRASFEVMLCDMHMPGETGLELISDVLRFYPDIAAVMVTGAEDPSLAEMAIELGAYGYMTKPFRVNELLIQVANALHRRRLELENRKHRARLELTVEEAVSDLESSQMELRAYQEETIRRLSSAAELRDLETGKHLDRMSRYCALLASKMGLADGRIDLIRVASPMHDVGKIAIPDSILLKPGSLTPDERRVMERHTEIGYQILSGSRAELLRLAADLAWTHHERFDGSGYPRGLSGEEIPLEGRIAAVADVFDALTTDRVYRKALSVDEAVGMMGAERGRHFDPEILDLFLASLEDVDSIRRQADEFADAA
jgi:putative two-component system response regulator